MVVLASGTRSQKLGGTYQHTTRGHAAVHKMSYKIAIPWRRSALLMQMTSLQHRKIARIIRKNALTCDWPWQKRKKAIAQAKTHIELAKVQERNPMYRPKEARKLIEFYPGLKCREPGEAYPGQL
jgi:hypothetical protein